MRRLNRVRVAFRNVAEPLLSYGAYRSLHVVGRMVRSSCIVVRSQFYLAPCVRRSLRAPLVDVAVLGPTGLAGVPAAVAALPLPLVLPLSLIVAVTVGTVVPVVVDVVRAVEVCGGAGQRRGGQTALRSTHILFGANAVSGGASSSITTGVPAPAALSCTRITATPAHTAAVHRAGPHVRVTRAHAFACARCVRVRRAGKRALETIARTRMPCITFPVPSYTVTLRGFIGLLYSRRRRLAESGGGFKPNSCEDDIKPKGDPVMRRECDCSHAMGSDA